LDKLSQDINKLKDLFEKQIDFDNISVQFKVEDRKNKKVYVLMENEEGYQLERKIGNKSFKTNLNSIEELKNQENLLDEDKEIFSKLFERLNNKLIDKISIGGLRLRNPILDASLRQAVTNNISNILNGKKYDKVREKLYELWEESKRDRNKKEEFDLFLRDIIVDILFDYIFKLESGEKDLPTPIFPTSVALSETLNYYICEPKEIYTLDTKIELFNKLASSICGRCGQRLCGLYLPEDTDEGAYTKDILKGYKNPDGLIDILRIAGVGRINLREIGPFEYVFYLLDRVFQEMFRRNAVPDFHVELIVQEKKTPMGKPFFYHYIIPNLYDVFDKLYHGDDKYYAGKSKIKLLISSFLVENWNIDNNLKRNNSEIAHAHINRLLYYIFCHRKLDMDSILFLEDLKIKLGDTTPIRYLAEVISWI